MVSFLKIRLTSFITHRGHLELNMTSSLISDDKTISLLTLKTHLDLGNSWQHVSDVATV